jgi:hypothetical protein
VSSLLDAWSAATAEGLAQHVAETKQTGARQWVSNLGDASRLSIEARLKPEWLEVEGLLPPAVALIEPGFGIFAVNSAVTPGLRLCAGEHDRRLRLRADVPVLDDTAIARRIGQLCAGLAAVDSWLASGAAGGPSSPSIETEAADFDLQQLCREAGWPFTVRDGDTVAVELEVPGVYRQAVLERRGSGVAVSAPVLAEAPTSANCSRAVAGFLLRITGALRMAAAVSDGDGVAFAIRFAAPPAAAELAHAFAALSVAWRCGAREAAVLARDEGIARRYLAARGEAGPDEVHNTHSS